MPSSSGRINRRYVSGGRIETQCATLCYMPKPNQVGVRELRQNLSVYLDRVKRGETLSVTEHNHIVAVLGPVRNAAHPLQALLASGSATPAHRPPSELPRPVRLKAGVSLSALVRELSDDVV